MSNNQKLNRKKKLFFITEKIHEIRNNRIGLLNLKFNLFSFKNTNSQKNIDSKR
jgi:hypothetical protein